MKSCLEMCYWKPSGSYFISLAWTTSASFGAIRPYRWTSLEASCSFTAFRAIIAVGNRIIWISSIEIAQCAITFIRSCEPSRRARISCPPLGRLNLSSRSLIVILVWWWKKYLWDYLSARVAFLWVVILRLMLFLSIWKLRYVIIVLFSHLFTQLISQSLPLKYQFSHSKLHISFDPSHYPYPSKPFPPWMTPTQLTVDQSNSSAAQTYSELP